MCGVFMTGYRIWYSIEELPLDPEGYTPAREFNNRDKIVTKIMKEELDLANQCVRLLVQYRVWLE